MPDRETLAQQIRELTRPIGQVSGYDSILGTHRLYAPSVRPRTPRQDLHHRSRVARSPMSENPMVEPSTLTTGHL